MNPRPPKAEPDADQTSLLPPGTHAGAAGPAEDTKPRPPGAPVPGAPGTYPFLQPARGPEELGRLGAYRVLAELGRGGMGVVFRAEDTRLSRHVALKVMLPDADDAGARARFRREAEAQAKVEHDHVAVIHHVGEGNGVPFIDMPLLKGQTLSAALKLSPRPPLHELVRVGREMAEGLAAAHEAGLIHRDIKPGNVWLEGSKRRVKLLDFGLARTNAGPTGDQGEPLTARGAILGTPSYMSPEQALGRPVDRRADLWSLGVVLYQMATGRLPFSGPTAFAVLTWVVEREPNAPRALVPDLPPALDALIRRLLAKNPDDRPASAEAVAAELEAIGQAVAELPVRVYPLDSAAGPNPWADIEATEPGTLADRRVRSRADSPKSPPPRRALALWGAAGLVVLAGTAALAVKVFKAAQPRGVLAVETEEPDWEVVVKRGGEVVRDRTRDREFVLPPGEYTVDSADPRPGLRAHPSRVSLAEGQRERVRLWAEKPKPPKPKEPEPPPAAPTADRKAAEALLPHAELTLRLASGEDVKVQPGDKLPAQAFVVYWVVCDERPVPADFVEAILLPSLADLRSLAVLSLRRTAALQFTEGCVTRLAEMPLAKRLLTFAPDRAMELTPRTLELLKQFPKLTYLGCSAASADDALLERLEELPALTVLSLLSLGQSGKVTDKGLRAVARVKVKQLEVRDSPAAAALIRLMPEQATPQRVYLRSPLADDDVKPLARCPDIQSLQLQSARLTDAGLRHLETMSNLRSLQVTNTKVTRGGVEALAKALPLCKIEWDGGVIEPK